MDRDGFISNGELFLVLKMMVGNNLKVGVPPASASKRIFESACRIHNSKRLWTKRSWRRTRTAMAS